MHDVADAIGMGKLYGLDLCTGVRIDDALDSAKLAAFMQAGAQA